MEGTKAGKCGHGPERKRRRRGSGQCRQEGNVGNIMITGIFILAMTVVMLAFLDDMCLIQQKAEVDQLARRYILRMETVGGLTPEDREDLLRELSEQGVTEIDLAGTTSEAAGYGAKIVLRICGKLGGKHAFEEKRVSTAKY